MIQSMKCLVFIQVYQNKSANFSGRRMHLLMLALPFVLCDLTFPEIEDITSQIAKPWHQLHDRVVVPPVDPSSKIIEADNTFMEWYLTVRMPEIRVFPAAAGRSSRSSLLLPPPPPAAACRRPPLLSASAPDSPSSPRRDTMEMMMSCCTHTPMGFKTPFPISVRIPF